MKCVLNKFEWCTRSSNINQEPVFATGVKSREGLEVFLKQYQMVPVWPVSILINLLEQKYVIRLGMKPSHYESLFKLSKIKAFSKT